jgi:outer membrane autotransporter protein
LPGASSNLQAMVNNLRVGDHQYAGGDLLALLLSPGLTAADVGVIGNRASPEAYAGFSSYADRVTSHYTHNAVNMPALVQTEKYAIFAGYTSFDTGSSSSVNQADYALKSKGAITGARVALSPRFTAGVFVGIDSGSLDSTYMNGSVKGNVYGVMGEYVADEERKLTVTGSVSTANYTSDGSRVTNGTGLATPGASRFKNVDSSASTASLAFKYRIQQGAAFLIEPELRLSYADTKVGGFTETNANTMQALSVRSQSGHSFNTEAAVNGSVLVNPQLSLNGRLGVSSNSADASQDVSANVAGEAESFSVRSPGMGRTAFSLGMGANYKVSDKWTVGVSYRKSMGSNAQDANSFYLNTALSF